MKISFGVLLSAVWAASSHGWTSDKVSWVTLDEAKEAAKTNGKPTMLLIHKRYSKLQKSTSINLHSINLHSTLVGVELAKH